MDEKIAIRKVTPICFKPSPLLVRLLARKQNQKQQRAKNPRKHGCLRYHFPRHSHGETNCIAQMPLPAFLATFSCGPYIPA